MAAGISGAVPVASSAANGHKAVSRMWVRTDLETHRLGVKCRCRVLPNAFRYDLGLRRHPFALPPVRLLGLEPKVVDHFDGLVIG